MADAWYPERAVMRRRSAGWIAVLAMVAGHPVRAVALAEDGLDVASPGAQAPAGNAAPLLHLPPRLAAAGRQPDLPDLTLYLELRAATAASDADRATALARRLLEQHPDSIWTGRARLDVGRVRRRTGDLTGALDWFNAAADALPEGDRAAMVVALQRAEVAHEMGDDERALERAAALRDGRPGGLIVRRTRRLMERIRRRPDREPTAAERVAEADLRLAEGDARGAQSAALPVLAASPSRELRDHALWVQARAAWALGMREAAEALCLALATGEPGAYNARALAQAARWRWNADDDAAALRLFGELAHRFPGSREAPEALYAIARIHQEAGAYDEALRAYDALAAGHSASRMAAEARWRAGWVCYLAGDYTGAADRFARLAPASERDARVAAEYWEARALENAGDAGARTKLAHVAEQHSTSFYGMLAGTRLGTVVRRGGATLDVERPAFPESLAGLHAIRARRYAEMGLPRLARQELEALAPSAPTEALLQAYAAVEAPGPAIRLARASLGRMQRRYLYPLGYWEVVRSYAQARGLDPLLVAALIRQESLFFPDAVSPADAHGLMQLLPTTARDVAAAAGRPPPDRAALHRVTTNVDLGTSLLRQLLDRYGGSQVKALAAYNAGEDAVTKWERRYAGRPEDEFVELISYRETRDYVKAVLTHYEVYRQLYALAPPPTASATSLGSPPNDPFDMITMTSPGRAESIR
jgi:soluble lytic murein transglycosylase